MIRKIIEINRAACNGCGLCIDACHEGALELVDGKAQLVSESYCDGLGDCLPECPTGAIEIIEREADAFDEEAVAQRMQQIEAETAPAQTPKFACPGSLSKLVRRDAVSSSPASEEKAHGRSELRQWPVQIQLVSVNAPFFDNAHLLIAADCTAFACGSFHEDFMRNRITLIGCPKLDTQDYTEKLTEIIKRHSLKSVSVLKMEVPCCSGLARAVQQALQNSGKMIPWSITTIGSDGEVLED